MEARFSSKTIRKTLSMLVFETMSIDLLSMIREMIALKLMEEEDMYYITKNTKYLGFYSDPNLNCTSQ